MVREDAGGPLIETAVFLQEFPLNCFVQVDTPQGPRVAKVNDLTAIVDGEPVYNLWVYPSLSTVNELVNLKDFGEMCCYFASEMKRLV